MRIYLDSSVFQRIKNDVYSPLLEAIIEDKVHNIYSYSSAHIQDLTRDRTDHKFDDLKFIETVVENNCWYFDKSIQHVYIPPTEYYGDSFPEYPEKVIDTEELFAGNEFLLLLRNMLQSFSLPLSSMMANKPLPENYPESIRELLTTTDSLWDMIQGLGGLTNEMASNQKSFKGLLSFLHGTPEMGTILQNLGISGHNGISITDKDAFRTSFINYFQKGNTEINRYDLFKKMYTGLEFFGIVKGKPNKQKMLNLIDDGSHAFFGAFHDIIVSHDDDLLNKTRFLYDLLDIQTLVLGIDEFHEHLHYLKKQRQNSFLDMLHEINSMEDISARIVDHEEENNKTVTTVNLAGLYFGYFDILRFVKTEECRWCYFSKLVNNYSRGTLIKEFRYITDTLVAELGEDMNGRSLFSPDEIVDEKWCGRVWNLGHAYVGLNYNLKMTLEIYVPDENKPTPFQR
jgi:hypothetical protein